MTSVLDVVSAIRGGGLAVIPTDTVYGLVCAPWTPWPADELARVKRRPADQPVALMTASVDRLQDCLPELTGGAEVVARALLPGPFTLVLPNPERRFPWLTGRRPETLGVRVPGLTGPGRAVLEAVGVIAATSANLHGEPDARKVDEIPSVLRAVAVVLDGGELLGAPSTLLDLTGPEPRVLREGAVSTRETLERVAAALDRRRRTQTQRRARGTFG